MEVLDDQHKFLKQFRQLMPGDVFPNIQLDNFRILDLMEEYMIVSVFSTECNSCYYGMEALNALTYSNLPNVVLIDADHEKLNMVKDYFGKNAKVFRFEKIRITNELMIGGLPIGIGINSVGQVINILNCTSVEAYKKLLKPFHRFIFSEVD